MTLRAIARRYAGALFEVAEQQRTLDQVNDDLRALRQLLASHATLRTALENAAVPLDRKRAVVDALIKAAHGMSGEVARLLTLLADRGRLQLLDDIAALFEERLLAHRRVIRAELVTASQLGDRARAAITKALSTATAGDVRLSERVDPEIIGGMTATLGGMVFDGSVVTRLERLRQQLHRQ